MKDINIYSLISKRLSGDITPEESNLLDSWLQQDETNRTEYATFETIWEKSASYAPVLEIDTDADFRQLTAKIKADETLSGRKSIFPIRSNTRTFLKVAAAIMLLFSVYWLFSSINALPPTVVVSTNQNEKKEVLLPDQSKVLLNKNSSISYPSEFDDQHRTVNLSGEAFFDIKRNVKQPFTVITENTMTTVLGTSFNIRSYKNEPRTMVAVKTGLVRVQSAEVNASVQLEPADIVSYDKYARTFEKKRDPSLAVFDWMSDKIVFDAVQLSDVLTQINEKYKLNIQLEDKQLGNCPFTAVFKDPAAEEILKSLVFTYQFELVRLETSILLKGGKCQ